MSWFTLAKKLTEGTTARASDVEEIFEGIAEALNDLFQVGKETSNATLSLTTSYADISGAKAEVTVARKSKLLAWTDVAQEAQEGWSVRLMADATEVGSQNSESQFFVATLEPGAHTIKMQGKSTEGTGKILAGALLYLIVPDPEP